MRALVTGNENKTKGMQWFWRWLFYILGLATLALGIICTVIISLVFEHKLVGMGIGTICAMILVVRAIALFNQKNILGWRC